MNSGYSDIKVVYSPSYIERDIFPSVRGDMTVFEFLNAEYVGAHQVKKPVRTGVFHINGEMLTDELGNTKLCDLANEYKADRVYIQFHHDLGVA